MGAVSFPIVRSDGRCASRPVKTPVYLDYAATNRTDPAVVAVVTRYHKTLRVTPAMAAGVSDKLRDVRWIVSLIEARTPPPGPRGPYRKSGSP